MPLAQINIARLLEPLDSPAIADFVVGLDPINALAERSPGFIWRLKDEVDNATNYRPFADDLVIVNMSVWENLDALRAFAFQTEHVEYIKRRREWFSRFPTAYMALWYVPEGHTPTIEEAKERLRSLDEQGETPFAFTFRKVFEPTNSL
jgi:heme-degrading monooxygenase HmoA